jgi:hypothetical protein
MPQEYRERPFRATESCYFPKLNRAGGGKRVNVKGLGKRRIEEKTTVHTVKIGLNVKFGGW